jgi:fibronectin type 3 domain-containing protein
VHPITAVYSGDSSHSGSSSPAVSQQVNSSHSVSLSWTASTSPNVVGYYIYRGTTPGGAYLRLNPTLVPGTNYVDTSVQAGQTYYYVCTAMDSSSNESAYSNEASGAVPSP